MNIQSPGKLTALVIVIVGCFAFILIAAQGDLDTTPAWSMLTLVVGYLIGNGTGALRGSGQQPVFTPSDNPPLAR